eukprot:CAMPEP_0113964600 /NCGR_PEP_ID=MMETSP0011_2-20120614/7245_1 /TAXON_ID=101924 /ORGANISM="Rhodosorus marinus" /LENGTH=77 /DNA_ID=CAMNT_0000976951 /DNA_START=148 /DNA_END=381 /DNA_ORIENTATION=+ /assembly_acc=CAM_ASM_000156
MGHSNFKPPAKYFRQHRTLNLYRELAIAGLIGGIGVYFWHRYVSDWKLGVSEFYKQYEAEYAKKMQEEMASRAAESE